MKQRWERDRALLGSKWAWLCHQIMTLNQKLYQLETLVQSKDPKETVQLTPYNPPPSPLTFPCVCGLQNGHNDHKITTQAGQQHHGNGPTLLSKPPVGAGGKVNGGVACTCQFRQMLLSNQSIVMNNHQLQVGDLMGCSFPVLVMDEANQVSARTRGTHRAPRRKLVREGEREGRKRRRESRSSGSLSSDASYHPHLSQPRGNGGEGREGGREGEGQGNKIFHVPNMRRCVFIMKSCMFTHVLLNYIVVHI